MRSSVTLIGPGGAGKTTIGAALAERLGIAFVDLDRRFEARAGDISGFIDRCGYRAYARENVETYRGVRESETRRVAALSSGFMIYPDDIHPEYRALRIAIAESSAVFVLIPSLDCEACVAETVRRQLGRPFARSAATEEAVIRERFPLYLGLSAPKVETMRPIGIVVEELLRLASPRPDRRSRPSAPAASSPPARS